MRLLVVELQVGHFHQHLLSSLKDGLRDPWQQAALRAGGAKDGVALATARSAKSNDTTVVPGAMQRQLTKIVQLGRRHPSAKQSNTGRPQESWFNDV